MDRPRFRRFPPHEKTFAPANNATPRTQLEISFSPAGVRPNAGRASFSGVELARYSR
jgi:hypothetical protein